MYYISKFPFSRSKDSSEMSDELQGVNCDTMSDEVRRNCDDRHDTGQSSSRHHVHSDNDSGCALEEYSWVPPGLKPDQVCDVINWGPRDARDTRNFDDQYLDINYDNNIPMIW